MDKTLNDILSRASTRNFKDEMVSDEEIDLVVKAGLKAPSAKNTQDNIIIVIKDKETRDKVSKINASILGMDRDPFYGAPVIIICAYNKNCPNGIYDSSLVLGNMMNACQALGLGSCWIHRARQEFEMEEFKEILNKLNLENEYTGVGHLAVGYIDGEEASPKDIKPNRVFTI